MFRVIISGVNGAMGRALAAAVQESGDISILAGFDKEIGSSPLPFKLYINPEDCGQGADALIDFSHFSATPAIMEYCVRTSTPAVIATTALGDSGLALLREAAKSVAVFHSANMSIGVNVVSRMARLAMPALEAGFDVEIIERHHGRKADSPSGTALLLANAINGACETQKDFVYGRHGRDDRRRATDLGIHAVRGGSLPGNHTVLFLGPDESIEISHSVFSKNVFALGAIKAARFVAGQAPGMYDMDDLISAGIR
ncbi:MAG: 4-hydroxy-tetrahydrodipicolinate reductase [Clostridiales Family XIII bacterium]|jgi:4-hydroxy-tetrahydrodipicolinate reductase|nr:4-hydroxy-tetrahydrodipicolinate reductase [Clostridiales Family XIII bacterium]